MGSAGHYDSQFSHHRQLRSDPKASKRVSFLDNDMIITIPNNEGLTTFSYPSRRQARPKECFAADKSDSRDTKSYKIVSAGKQVYGKRCTTAHTQEPGKEIKSILKRSSTESSIQRTSKTLENYRNSFLQSNHFDLNPHMGFRYSNGAVESPIKYQFLGRKTLPINSEISAKFGSVQSKHCPHVSISTASSASRRSFSPSKTISQKQPPNRLQTPLHSQSSKEINPNTLFAPVNTLSGVSVGNNINITDLYPAISNFQIQSSKQSARSSFLLSDNDAGAHSRYITARERISRAGNHNRFKTRALGNTNLENSVSPGLSGVAEASLLNRLRKYEHSDPYVAWQAVARSSLSSSPLLTRPSTMGSYLLGGNTTRRANFERVYIPKDLSSQNYY